MLLRHAEPRDLDALVAMYEYSLSWLSERSQDQWHPDLLDPEMMRAAILASIHRGETWCAVADADPVGMIVIKEATPPGLWTPAEEAEPHRYAYLAMVSPAATGTGLGADLLDWATDHVAAQGARWLRGDIWTSNRRLVDYYLHRGWRLVRVVERSRRLSGTLIQRPAERVPTARWTIDRIVGADPGVPGLPPPQ